MEALALLTFWLSDYGANSRDLFKEQTRKRSASVSNESHGDSGVSLSVWRRSRIVASGVIFMFCTMHR